MREVERQSQLAETRFLHSKQDFVSRSAEGELKLDFTQHKLASATEETLRIKNEAEVFKCENLQLKADLRAQKQAQEQILTRIEIKKSIVV